MDNKFSNIVRIVTHEGDVLLKAIDFGISCYEDEGCLIPGDTTPAYSCPEIAKFLMNSESPRSSLSAAVPLEKPKVSHKMDVMALGFMVFELLNNSVSYWKSLTPPIEDDGEILKALAELTDEEVKHNVHVAFPGERFRALQSWLCHALKVNPNQRATAAELQEGHSVFGNKDPTLDAYALVSKIDSLHGGMDSLHVDVKQGFQRVIFTLEEMNLKLDVLSETTNDFGVALRQSLIEASESNHRDIRGAVVDLSDILAKNMVELQAFVSSSTTTRNGDMMDEMKMMISTSLNSIKEHLSIGDEIKVLLVDAFNQCNETAQGALNTEQLDRIIASLNDIQCDVSTVMSEK
jgi:serine/threonine protein kinase